MTLFTRMKRSHLLPPARELYAGPKSYGGWYRMPDPAADPHPVEWGLLGAAAFSLLIVVLCVIGWLFQSLQDDVDYQQVQFVSDVLFWALLVFLGSTGLYLVWSRFVRHG